MSNKELGKWAFIVGAVIAIITGIGAGLGQAWGNNIWLMVLLIVAGIVVGIINITAKEVQGFLIASVAVLVANTANLGALVPGLEQLGAILAGIVGKMLVVVAPAALIVALKAVYGFAAEE
jgi:hypothetical protein